MSRCAASLSLLKKALSPRVKKLLRRFQIETLDLVQLWYWNKARQTRPPIPPYALRARVGSPNIQAFLTQGRRHVEDLHEALHAVDRDFSSFKCILDFGCGAGRQTRWLQALAPNATIWGCDLDGASITWASKHLPFGTFVANSPLPPVPLQTQKFDLIFAVSIFTHLNEKNQIQWLTELYRIAAPDCILLLTTHGPHALTIHRQNRWYSDLCDGVGLDLAYEDLEKVGFLFKPYPRDFSQDYGGQYGMAYHSHRYVRNVWSRFFRILCILPAGLEDHQDIIVLTKTSLARNGLTEAN